MGRGAAHDGITPSSPSARSVVSAVRLDAAKYRGPETSDAEVRAILVSATAEVGADPALIYAFQKAGVYLCEENERRLSKRKLRRRAAL
jgi:hypothetical protein